MKRRKNPRRKLRLTGAPHGTPISLDVSEDGKLWTAGIARVHIIPVNSAVMRAYRGRAPRVRT